MFISFKRTIRAGYLSFRRNGWLSTATVMVVALVLFVLGGLIFVGAFAQTIISSLESKIDIRVYFVPEAEENKILAIKSELESLPDVKEVFYTSRDVALANFRERHKTNALILDALEELGENPLEASINIKARDPLQYAAISEFLLVKNYAAVDKINYFENQKVIDRLGAIVGTVRGLGALAIFVLGFIAILVAFNTVRLAIYTMRDEIGVMRLVGASQWFIRGPFLVTGLLYGVIAAVGVTLIFFPLTWLASPKLQLLVSDFDLFRYFVMNFWEFFMVMLITGILLGFASSMIAIRRYLKV